MGRPTDTGRRRIRSWAACAFLVVTCAWGVVPVTVRASARPQIFVYVSNETASDGPAAENTRAIVQRLRSVGGEKLNQIADGLEHEMVRFPEVVDQELEVIGRRLPTLGRAGPAVVVFTNRLMRQGHYLEYRPSDVEFAERTLALPPHDDLILANNPLCRPDVFAILLREVARRFDPAGHEFVLMTKSHGNEELAMTPRVCRLASDIGPQELAALAGVGDGSEEGATSAPRLGTTRQQYFDILGELGRTKGMRFALVYVEACEGQFVDELKVQLPRNVARMYATAGGAEYRNVDFDALFDRIAAGTSLAAVLEEQLAAQSPGIVHTPPWRRWARILLWIPLLLWLGWRIKRAIFRKPPSV